MADQKIILDLAVKTAEAAKNVGDLRKSFDEARKAAQAIGKQFGQDSQEYKKAEQTLSGLLNKFKEFGGNKQGLKESRVLVQGLADAYGATSKEAVAAAKAAAMFKDNIGDADELISAFNPDKKFQAFGAALQATAGGFAAVQGAMALFGGESKEVEKIMLKVQAAMALSQGIDSILAAQKQFKVLAVVIKTNVVAAFATLKAAIITTGIGALVVALGFLAAKMMEMAASTETAAAAQERLKNATDAMNDAAREQIDLMDDINQANIKRARIAGESEEQIAARERKAIQDRIDGRVALMDSYIAQGMSIKQLAEDNSKDITALQNFDLDQQVKSADKKRDNDKDAADKDKAARDKRNKERLAQIEANNKAADALEKENTLELYKLNHTEAEIRIHEERLRHARNLQILKDANRDTKDEVRRHLDQIAVIHKEEAKKAEDAEFERLNGIVQASNDRNKTARESVRTSLEEGYKEQIAMAKTKAEAIEAIERMQLENINALGSLLTQFAGKNKALAIAGIVITQAAAVAKTIMSTNAAIMAYKLTTAPLGPAGLPLQAAYAIQSKISAGLSIASSIAAAAKGIGQINGAGPGSGGGGLGSISSASMPSAAAPATPANTTILDASTINAMANQALRAYVVESEITSGQQRIQRIRRSAILGG
jgi:hypothetical protein